VYIFLVLSIFISLVAGCSATPTRTPQEQIPHSPSATLLPAAHTTQADAQPVPLTVSEQSTIASARLQDLRQKRAAQTASPDYPIGSGDVLEISVPAIDEISTRTVRVAGDGMIELPFIGIVKAAGLTEVELREVLRGRLQTYMHHPRVTVFTREYRSRQVAVLGAVEKPGLYMLASGSDTVLDMLSLAGGLKEGAVPRLYLLPAEPLRSNQAQALAATLPIKFTNNNPSPQILKSEELVEIDLHNLGTGGSPTALALPARPGDVLIVPGGGEVLVQGWVEKPASYKITPGLTVLGAVAAAGGPHFAADTSSIRVIRNSNNGDKTFFVADLEKIKSGESADLTVQEGDVIEVASSSSKLVPYGMYHFFTSVFHVGTSISGF
jgi:polysaccharide export outer membrane protein